MDEEEVPDAFENLLNAPAEVIQQEEAPDPGAVAAALDAVETARELVEAVATIRAQNAAVGDYLQQRQQTTEEAFERLRQFNREDAARVIGEDNARWFYGDPPRVRNEGPQGFTFDNVESVRVSTDTTANPVDLEQSGFMRNWQLHYDDFCAALREREYIRAGQIICPSRGLRINSALAQGFNRAYNVPGSTLVIFTCSKVKFVRHVVGPMGDVLQHGDPLSIRDWPPSRWPMEAFEVLEDFFREIHDELVSRKGQSYCCWSVY